jgi:TolA-binding protein
VAPASATPASAAPASAAPVSAAPPTNAANANTDALKAARAKADAKLWDQALADVKAILARNPPANVASSALLLMGTIHVGQERPDEAMAAYIELRSRYGNSPVVAEATYHLADLLLRSKRTDRDTAAIEMFGEVVNNHANSPWAPRALVRRAAVEERTRARVTDQQVGAMVPAALISYRTLVEKYPGSDGEENALDKLAEMYDNLRRYDLAGQMLMTLATKFPANKRDAAWRAGELYERRLKDSEKARAAYALVPAQSSRYRDAQKKLSEKN